MTSYQNALFSFTRVKDKFRLVNKTTSTINYDLYVVKKGINSLVESGNIININDNKVFDVPNGFYELVINGTTLYFSQLNTYREKAVDLIKRAVCKNCGCNDDCSDGCLSKEAKDCLRNQTLFNFIQTYMSLIKPYSVIIPKDKNKVLYDFIQTTLYNNKDWTSDQLAKQLLDTCITAQSYKNSILFNYFIGIYYLGLYKYDMESINSSLLSPIEVDEEVAYLKDKYQYDTIIECLKGLGISPNIIIADISSTIVYFWQGTPSDDIVTIGNLINTTYLTTRPSLNLSVFQQGHIIPYTNVGKAVFFVKDTPITNYLIVDAAGNDITDEFDIDYFNSLSGVLLVSKNPYVISNIYFKFKTL